MIKQILEGSCVGVATGFLFGTGWNTIVYTMNNRFTKEPMIYSLVTGLGTGVFTGIAEANPRIGGAIMIGTCVSANLFYMYKT